MSPKLGKRKRREIAEREANSRIVVIPPPDPPNDEPPSESWFWKGANRLYIYGGLIVIVLAIIGFIWTCNDRNKTQQEKNRSPQEKQNDEYDTGTLHPEALSPEPQQGYATLEYQPVLSSQPPKDNDPIIKGILLDSAALNFELWFNIADNTLPIPSFALKKGITILFPFRSPANFPSHPAPSYKGCDTTRVSFWIHGNRLYISCDFYDLENGELIGSIEYNHWKLWKRNRSGFNNDDERLEVRDKRKKIVFEIAYGQGHSLNNEPKVLLGGYFLSSKSVTIIPNAPIKGGGYCYCFLKSDSNWKQEAEEKIDSILPVFTIPKP